MAEGNGNGDDGPPAPDLTNLHDDNHNKDTAPKDDVAAVNYQAIPLSPVKVKPLHSERPKRQTAVTAAAKAQIPAPQMAQMVRGLR